MTEISPHIPITSSAFRDEIFADNVTNFFVYQSVVRITLDRMGADEQFSRVVIGALCMPIDAAENIAKALLKNIEASRQTTSEQAETATKPRDAKLN